MPTAAALRLEIEHALERKFPAALTPAPRAIDEVAATGIRAVDELLHGGLPVGAISELTGAASSGRTSLALQFVAQRTAEERACAWVDVSDAFDPESAAANGVRLKQLLWMRCGSRDQVTNRRRERDKGTRNPFGHKLRRERGARAHPSRDQTVRKGGANPRWVSAWARLDQGLRATDLLLQAGGFAAIVLDLGDMAPEQASRIPLATWFRYRQAAERTQCSLVVVGARGYAQSAAAVVLECSARNAEHAGGTVLRGFEFAVRRERERQAPIEITTSEAAGRDLAGKCGVGCGESAHEPVFACAWAAEFPAQALLRLRTDWQTEPVVVLDGRAPEEWVCSLNRLAERRGAAVGMTRLEAESMQGLRLLKRSAESEAAARAVMLECAAKFSPRIQEEVCGAGLNEAGTIEVGSGTACAFVLDIAGTERLFGPPAQLAERLREELAGRGFARRLR
jgi:recombination protein RecA